MKVLLNTKPLLYRKAGIGYYVQNLIKQLELKDLDLIFSHGLEGEGRELAIRAWSGSLKRLMGPLYPSSLAAKAYNLLMDPFYRYYQQNDCGRDVIDIYHETSHCVLPHIFNNTLVHCFVADIHDLSPVRCPEYHLNSLVEDFMKTFPQLLGADKFISKSQFVREEIIQYYGIPSSRIEVVPNAPSYPYRFLGRNRHELRKDLCLRLPGFPDRPFILYTGTIEPRKNLEILFRAFSRLHLRNDLHLVVAGGFGWKYEPIIRLPEQLGIQDRVHFLGYQPFDVFELLYNAAEVFVYPSLYEGFGMPNVEAMQCGTPVITSNASCLPEVVGDAALLFDPKEPDELVVQLELILDSDELRESLRAKGFLRAQGYSWETIGEQIYQIYKKLAS